MNVATVPGQPTNLQGETVSPNSIQLSWDPPQLSPGEAIESFELYYNDSHLRKNIRLTIAPPTNSYRLEDLTPNTVYHIRVAAKSSHGVGASTPTIQVRTMEYGEWINPFPSALKTPKRSRLSYFRNAKMAKNGRKRPLI